ncbi:hypothetical protein [Caldilinea sp.]|jgi:DNA-binding response OmpR family regulator|uniref:hypothetical protein n=1 Tax=Caldilinea sp. TaxID=2293560 RepID=UPI0021DDB9E4|nr:hypothetical protein [Caldilinea sp.]GIV73489.1 MAG: hypothetical protein KatS3mg049_2045 [Caldilinea sp.]
MTLPLSITVVLVGRDERLSYLLRRYIEQSGCHMAAFVEPPALEDVARLQPAALIFSSIEHLREAQRLVESLSCHDIPVLVCGSPADEVCARELGADACLLHPLVFDEFHAALALLFPPNE